MDIEIKSEAVLRVIVEGRNYTLLLPPVAPGKEIYEVLQGFMDKIQEIAQSQSKELHEKRDNIPAAAD